MSRTELLLGVNIDHSATVRQARYRGHELARGRMVEPDPVAIALEAERAGADAITLHLREDRRHIVDADVYRMREMISTAMNLEMAATDEMTQIACKVKPEVVLLVPESRAEVTTEGGLDVTTHKKRIAEVIKTVQAQGIAVSLFIDPHSDQIDASAELGAEYIELHTGAYANAYYEPAGRARELAHLQAGAIRAHKAGLKVNAGHGLNYVNIREIRDIPHLYELNIGHSIIARALFTGIAEAVREMKRKMNFGA